MHTHRNADPEWRPTLPRLILCNSLPVGLGVLIAQILIAFIRSRPISVPDVLLYEGAVLVVGVLFSLSHLHSQRFVLRGTATTLHFPAATSARHSSVALEGIVVPTASQMSRSAWLLSATRIANADGSYLAMQPAQFPPAERARLLAFLSAANPAA